METKSVTVGTVGGLGNQLFQVAATLAYAWREGRRPFFVRNVRSESAIGTRDTYWSTVFASLDQISPAEMAKLDGVETYRDEAMGHRPIPSSIAKIVRLRGYMQHLEYFEPYWDKIRTLLFSDKLWMDAAAHLRKLISVEDLDKLAFAHVRRGDTKKLQHTHPILPITYYAAAVQRFPSDTRFVLFCEAEDRADIERELAAILMPNGSKLIDRIAAFVDAHTPDYDQLLQMAQCPRGGILANSSFSLWASYLHIRSPLHSAAAAAAATFVSPVMWFVDPKMTMEISGACPVTQAFARGGQWWRITPEGNLGMHWRPRGVVMCAPPGRVHERNVEAMLKICTATNVPFRHVISVNEAKTLARISGDVWDVFWFPCTFVDNGGIFASKRILFGPHFWVFPEGELVGPTEPLRFANCFYNVLSSWNMEVQKEFGGLKIPIKAVPFALDTQLFQPVKNAKRDKVIVMWKHRPHAHLDATLELLKKQQIPADSIVQFRYGGYKRDEWRVALMTARFAIWVGCAESQGFGVQECLSMNVPLLVWTATTLYDETNDKGEAIYEHLKTKKKTLAATTVPYWDARCGIVVRSENELRDALPGFIGDVGSGSKFAPRAFAVETLSVEACAFRLFSELASLRIVK